VASITLATACTCTHVFHAFIHESDLQYTHTPEQIFLETHMKRQRSSSTSYVNTPYKRPRVMKAAPAAVVTSTVRREMRKNADVKYTDVSALLSNITYTGSIVSATTNLVRGLAGIDNFQGNIITPVGFTGKFTFSSGVNNNAVCRIMVFQWFDASVPTLAGILQNTTTGFATMSPVLVTNKSQIRVLFDRSYYVNVEAGGDTTSIGNGGITSKFYIPGSRLKKIKYNSTTNAIQDGAIYTLYLTDDNTANFPQYAFYNRLSFTDV